MDSISELGFDPTFPHYFTHAIVGKVTTSLADEGSVDAEEARRQHESLLRVLRELNVDVVELELHGTYKNSLLIDRLAVSARGIVFLPTPRTAVEEYNSKALKNILTVLCGQEVIEQKNPEARICGSDVLYTGKEIVVGLCETTNQLGAIEIASAFSDFPVCGLKMPAGADHLKNYVTMAGDSVMVIGTSKESRLILSMLERGCSKSYQKLIVKEEKAANCLYVNHTLIHRAIEEIPESFKYFCEKVRYARRSICFSEFDKLSSAGLSSVCLMVKKI